MNAEKDVFVRWVVGAFLLFLLADLLDLLTLRSVPSPLDIHGS
jgi:hypothetical protein